LPKTIYIWFPYKNPQIPNCWYNTPFSFTPILSASQKAITPKSLNGWLEVREIIAQPNIYSCSREGKRKNVPEVSKDLVEISGSKKE